MVPPELMHVRIESAARTSNTSAGSAGAWAIAYRLYGISLRRA
jgi:hypothetical protein